MIVNKEQFEKNLERIGQLYEEGKDCLSNIMTIHPSETHSRSRLYEILREMRDIAAVNLKSNHEIKEN